MYESISYQDVAISQQTQRARIVFEDNAGLAKVHPVDFSDEAIALHRSRLPLPPGAPAASEPEDVEVSPEGEAQPTRSEDL